MRAKEIKVGSVLGMAFTAGLILAPELAMAQIKPAPAMTEAQESELYCVHDELIWSDAGLHTIVEAYLNADSPADKKTKAEEAMAEAADTCAEEFDWDGVQTLLAEEIGLHAAVGDYLIDLMAEAGLEQQQVHAIDLALIKLPAADADRLLNDEWVQNGALSKRLDAALIAHKFPGDADLLALGRMQMAVTAQTLSAVHEWVNEYIKK